MTNIPSQQVSSEGIIYAKDQYLSSKKLREVLMNTLGVGECSEKKFGNHKYVVYSKANGIKEILLVSAVTYLGNPHPAFKKRIQLQPWFKDLYNNIKNNDTYNLRFIGIYHFNSDIIFVDFVKESYLPKSFNNSSAHVYINDLFKAKEQGIFTKFDQNNNQIFTIYQSEFKKYIDGSVFAEAYEPPSLRHLKSFVNKFPFYKWILAKDAIPEMYYAPFSQWRQGEWPGFYLEYLFEKHTFDINNPKEIVYTASLKKRDGELDFDIEFPYENFLGDLKSSQETCKEAIGNDKETFLAALKKYGKFWYIIFEHDTKFDRFIDGHPATKTRNEFIRKVTKDKPSDLSYLPKMKHSVMYKKVTIIELHLGNYESVLKDFHQGKQPDGSPRAVKFSIIKKYIDNCTIFSYSPSQIHNKNE